MRNWKFEFRFVFILYSKVLEIQKEIFSLLSEYG